MRRLIVTAIISSLCAISPLSAGAQSQLAEYEVKAAFLFNFTKFVEWPENSFTDVKAPLVLAIIGDDPFGPRLSWIVAGQMVQGRRILVRRQHFGGESLGSCQVLFIGDSERAHVPQILASTEGTSVLTVSDIDGFAESGGIVQFVIEESRVRFVINMEAASKARLRINSKLLAVARVIKRATP